MADQGPRARASLQPLGDWSGNFVALRSKVAVREKANLSYVRGTV